MKSGFLLPRPFLRFLVFPLCLLTMGSLSATQPTIVKTLPNQCLPTNAAPIAFDLTNYIKADLYPNANLVRVTTSLSDSNGVSLGFTMELFPSNAPQTVNNFLAYANDGAYENTLVHRSAPGFVIQTGGYTDYDSGNWNVPIVTFTNIVPSEYGLSNLRGTLAMALVGSDSNSATDQWFVNLADNSSILDNTNTYGNPPFTVFAQVIGNGMSVVDQIAAFPTYSGVINSTNPIYKLASWLNSNLGFNFNSPFYDLPIQGITTNTPSLVLSNLVKLTHVATVPYFALSSDPNSYAANISNSTLTVSYTGGTNLPATPVSITVYASDTNGLTTNSTFQFWYQTNTTPKVDYISQILYSTNSIYQYLYYPSLPDGSPITNVSFSWPAGLLNKNNNYSISGTGTLTLIAISQPTFFYKASTNVFKIHIGKNQTINFPNIAMNSTNSIGLTTNSSNAISFTTNAIALHASSDSTLQISYTRSDNSPCKISGSNLLLNGVGTVTVIANQTGNSFYLAATPVTNNLFVTQASQTITFPAIPNQVQSRTAIPLPVPLKATASSGQPITYRCLSSNATITNNTVQAKTTGTIVIEASQAGTNTYLPAESITNTFVSKLSQSLTPLSTISSKTFTNPYASFTINVPTTTAQTATNVAMTASGPASISNSLVTIIGAGTVTLTATQAGDNIYFPASVSTKFVVAKSSQKIAPLNAVASKTNGIAAFPVTLPLCSSGLPVTITATGAGYATTNGSNVLINLTNAGTVKLAASQIGNSNYLSATPVTTSFTVAKGSQIISFPAINTHHFLDSFPLLASASPSGLPITFSIISGSNVALLFHTNNATWMHITGLSGSVTLAATQAGSTGYTPATSLTNSFTISP